MRKGFTRRPKVEEPTAKHGKNYITPGGIEHLKDERHFLLTKGSWPQKLEQDEVGYNSVFRQIGKLH
jgi:hypothetical protein